MLKKTLLSLSVLLTFSSIASAQPWAIDLFAGTANYQGDLLEKKYTMANSKLALGVGASYAYNGHFRIRGMLTFAKLTADDKDNSDPALVARNLNFFTNITEFSLTAHYDILDLKYNRLTPYIFAGVGVFRFNPYTYDSSAGRVYLKPLSTEGQGLSAYPDRKPYSLTQFNLPFGGGLKFRVSDGVMIAWEIGLRKTSTDYLDDLSTTYADQFALLSERGQTAVDVAWRGDEVKTNPQLYPPGGTIRGGPKFKDWYYFSGITASFNIDVSAASPDKKGSTACPKF
ncbi:MAG TPA: DUF6089 family protein [Chitinophagaceae bacterium]|nr:DUF6089 family protein [Chitinophagaceae bacterium]